MVNAGHKERRDIVLLQYNTVLPLIHPLPPTQLPTPPTYPTCQHANSPAAHPHSSILAHLE